MFLLKYLLCCSVAMASHQHPVRASAHAAAGTANANASRQMRRISREMAQLAWHVPQMGAVEWTSTSRGWAWPPVPRGYSQGRWCALS